MSQVKVCPRSILERAFIQHTAVRKICCIILIYAHYIDNSSYSRENPGFDHILAHIITLDDVLAYDNFVALSRFSVFASNRVNFAYEIKSSVDTIGDVKAAVNNGEIISFDTANAVYGLASFSPGDSVRRGDLIVTSFKSHYESVASVAEL